MGTTFSITIPEPLEATIRKLADIKGMSRSGYICSVLIDHEKNINDSQAPNECPNRDFGGDCNIDGNHCTLSQKEVNLCLSNMKRKGGF